MVVFWLHLFLPNLITQLKQNGLVESRIVFDICSKRDCIHVDLVDVHDPTRVGGIFLDPLQGDVPALQRLRAVVGSRVGIV